MVVLLCIFSAIPLKLCLWSQHWFLCTPQVSTASQLFDTGIWGVQSSSAYQVSELRKKQTNLSINAGKSQNRKQRSHSVFSRKSHFFSKLLQCLSVYIICDFLHWYITEMAVKTNTIVKSCLQHGHANRTTMAKRLLLLSFTKAITASMNAPVIFSLAWRTAFFLLFKKNRSTEKMRPVNGEKYHYASIASSRNAIIDMPLSDIDILIKHADSVSGFPQQQQTAPINSALEGYNNTAPIPYGDY